MHSALGASIAFLSVVAATYAIPVPIFFDGGILRAPAIDHLPLRVPIPVEPVLSHRTLEELIARQAEGPDESDAFSLPKILGPIAHGIGHALDFLGG